MGLHRHQLGGEPGGGPARIVHLQLAIDRPAVPSVKGDGDPRAAARAAGGEVVAAGEQLDDPADLGAVEEGPAGERVTSDAAFADGDAEGRQPAEDVRLPGDGEIDRDFLGTPDEHIIGESSTLTQTVNHVLQSSCLAKTPAITYCPTSCPRCRIETLGAAPM